MNSSGSSLWSCRPSVACNLPNGSVDIVYYQDYVGHQK
jgi:hypothetical protein